jgi:hypothetical protein
MYRTAIFPTDNNARIALAFDCAYTDLALRQWPSSPPQLPNQPYMDVFRSEVIPEHTQCSSSSSRSCFQLAKQVRRWQIMVIMISACANWRLRRPDASYSATTYPFDLSLTTGQGGCWHVCERLQTGSSSLAAAKNRLVPPHLLYI